MTETTNGPPLYGSYRHPAVARVHHIAYLLWGGARSPRADEPSHVTMTPEALRELGFEPRWVRSVDVTNIDGQRFSVSSRWYSLERRAE